MGALALLGLTMLAGCATSDGNPKLQVAIPADCERLAVRVPVPMVKAGEDARAAAARYAVATGTANRRLDAVRDCEAKLRARFAKGGA